VPSKFSRLKSAWSKSHPFLDGTVVARSTPCSFCQSQTGFKIGEVAFWDIADMDVVQCQQCRQMQLDPMLSADQVVAGCIAGHAHEKHRLPPRWFVKNNKRHFRAGVRFAAYLESKGIRPRRIMEMGPGEGYFSRALATMIPGLEVMCLDADEQVAIELKRDHGFETHVGLAEDLSTLPDNDFDLIITRDFLEHLIDPAKVIQNCHRLLKPGGHLYTLTPNGYQDVWHIYLRWMLYSDRTDLFINHLNYFDGAALVAYMDQSGLTPVDCYQEGAKPLTSGDGWSFDPKHAGPPPERLPHRDYFFEQENVPSVSVADVLPSPMWLNNPFFRKLLSLRTTMGHLPKLKFSIDRQVGHYISCLNQKRDTR
jgi:SAM-dependent methyltransferase